MDYESLRYLIGAKLKQGLLPYDSIPRIWGGAAKGERCDGCDLIIEEPDLVMEGIAMNDENTARHTLDRRRPLQLHVLCFSNWDSERRAP